MIHRRIQTLPATRAQQLNPVPRRRRAGAPVVPLSRRRRRPGTRKEAARLLVPILFVVVVRLVLRIITDIRKPPRGGGCAARRHAHVQRLDRVRLGLAVGAVGDVAGAVGLDDFGFGEAWPPPLVSTCIRTLLWEERTLMVPEDVSAIREALAADGGARGGGVGARGGGGPGARGVLREDGAEEGEEEEGGGGHHCCWSGGFGDGWLVLVGTSVLRNRTEGARSPAAGCRREVIRGLSPSGNSLQGRMHTSIDGAAGPTRCCVVLPVWGPKGMV